jgi:hypothetical protein
VAVCEDASLFQDCHTYCKDYLQQVIVMHTTKERSDIHTLTVMVAVTAAMTSIVLIAVFCLITMKVNKKRSRLRKKVEPSSLFTVEREKVELGLVNPSGPPPLRPGTSLQTVSTQLSNETVLSTAGLAGPRGSRRAPSEDCVAGDGRGGGSRESCHGQVV